MGDLARYIDNNNKKSPDNKSRSGKFARDYYQTAKDLDPRHGKPHFNLGILASEQQRHFEAIIHFIRAASVDKAGGSSGQVHFFNPDVKCWRGNWKCDLREVQTQAIFEINVGKKRIRHKTALNSNVIRF